jgi:hypothetical protein
MNTQLPECIPASFHCTPIEPCPTLWPHCPGPGAGNPGPIGPTGIQHCTAAPAFCGNTAWPGCHIGYTGWLTCVPPAGTPHPGTIGPTGWHTCSPATICPPVATATQPGITNPTLQTRCFICPPPQAGPTGVHYCTSAPHVCGNTAWQGCTQHGCPIGPTGWHTCSPATVCHQVTGPNPCITVITIQPPCPPATLDVCITPPPTPHQPCLGPTGWQTCVAPAGAAQFGAHTAATVCTQFGCHTHVQATNCPPATVCPQPTTLCPPAAGAAQAQTGPIGPTGIQHCTIAPAYCGNTAWHGCPQHTHVQATNCPPATVCPQPTTLCPPPPGAAQVQTGPIGPTGIQHCTIAPAYCGNTAWHGCPQQTLATVCTQLGCPPPAEGANQPGAVGPTGIQHCTIAPPYCGNTHWAGCNPQAGPTPSAVTLCPGCGPLSQVTNCPTVPPLCFTVAPFC